jgi:hypothetical protein
VLDTQKRPRLVSCVLSPEWVYFCFLSNFYFDVYRRRLSGPSARLAQRYSPQKPLLLGVCVSLVIFARSKTVQGCVADVLSGEHVGTWVFFLFVYLFVFLGIDFSRIYHISMLDWPPDTGLDAVFLGKRFQTHDTYKHNHSLFSTLISLLFLSLSVSYTHTHTAQPGQSNLASHPAHATAPMPRHSNLDSTSGKQVGRPSAQFGYSD